jgi:hypothetical protein
VISSWRWTFVLRLEYSPPGSGVDYIKLGYNNKLMNIAPQEIPKKKKLDLRALTSKCRSSLKYTPSHSPPQTYMFIPCKMAEWPDLPRGGRASMRTVDHCLVPSGVYVRFTDSLSFCRYHSTVTHQDSRCTGSHP